MKSVKMLNSRTENLDQLLSSGQSSTNRYSQKNSTRFVSVSVKENSPEGLKNIVSS